MVCCGVFADGLPQNSSMLSRILSSVINSGASPRALPQAHRPILKRDVERMRWCVDGSFVLPKQNPGVRVEPDFVTEEEAAGIAHDLRSAAELYGYSYDGDGRAHLMDSASGSIEATLSDVVNNVRVTGRLEKPGLQKIPPWGHGDTFDASQLPPNLAMLGAKIAGCGAFRVGPPRDATINMREHSFFQLDPHVDPASDGPDVFILGLESSVVLTFSPPDSELAARGLPPRRRDGREVGLRSWTDLDIDVLVQPRSLVHFTGAARDSWMHAIRSGVQVGDPDAQQNQSEVCDWWGQTDYLVKRGPRRLSVVLAFGAPPPPESNTPDS